MRLQNWHLRRIKALLRRRRSIKLRTRAAVTRALPSGFIARNAGVLFVTPITKAGVSSSTPVSAAVSSTLPQRPVSPHSFCERGEGASSGGTTCKKYEIRQQCNAPSSFACVASGVQRPVYALPRLASPCRGGGLTAHAGGLSVRGRRSPDHILHLSCQPPRLAPIAIAVGSRGFYSGELLHSSIYLFNHKLKIKHVQSLMRVSPGTSALATLVPPPRAPADAARASARSGASAARAGAFPAARGSLAAAALRAGPSCRRVRGVRRKPAHTAATLSALPDTTPPSVKARPAP